MQRDVPTFKVMFHNFIKVREIGALMFNLAVKCTIELGVHSEWYRSDLGGAFSVYYVLIMG